MQTRDNEKKSEERQGKGEEKRDLELENIVGNLLIAESGRKTSNHTPQIFQQRESPPKTKR
jgi:hypothetical protein